MSDPSDPSGAGSNALLHVAMLEWPTRAQITQFRGQGSGCSALALLGEMPGHSLLPVLADLNGNWKNAQNPAMLVEDSVCSGCCAEPFPGAGLL